VVFHRHRKWIASTYVPGNFYNRVNGTMFYEPDRSRPAFSTNRYLDDSVRLTWQATSKDKVSAGFSGQDVCTCPVSTSTAFSPEATGKCGTVAQLHHVGELDVGRRPAVFCSRADRP
jgi:hypothetical protein